MTQGVFSQRVIETDAHELMSFLDMRDVLRYSGCRGEVEGELLTLSKQCVRDIINSAKPRAVYIESQVKLSGDDADFGFYKCTSRSLRQFLGSDSDIHIFAATLGIGVDRLIMRYSPILQSRAVMLDGAAAAVIEAFCDKLCREVLGCADLKRFSPGYGDLPLVLQRDILEYLEAPRLIGLTLTESLMLSPSKSVTAITQIKR